STASGSFFSVKGGILSFNGNTFPDNTVAAVVIDFVLENVYYEGKFDPETPTNPKCFAFGREDADMAPHEVSTENGDAQNDVCKGCQWNEWGSAETGRGKACKNRRRLALIPAGAFNSKTNQLTPYDADEFETATMGFLALPVTSVKAFSGYVKQLGASLK